MICRRPLASGGEYGQHEQVLCGGVVCQAGHQAQHCLVQLHVLADVQNCIGEGGMEREREREREREMMMIKNKD